jgi:hypothetical protein
VVNGNRVSDVSANRVLSCDVMVTLSIVLVFDNFKAACKMIILESAS